MPTDPESRYRALVRAIGFGFHPDTDGGAYPILPDGYTAESVNQIIDAADAEEDIDIYVTALEEFAEMSSREAALAKTVSAAIATEQEEEAEQIGCYLVGLPVGVSILADGSVTLSVYAEDMDKALREDDATAEHREMVEAALWQRRDAKTVLG